MSDVPTEPYEHAEHARHAAHSGDDFLAKVTITVAVLAVIAATIGSLETMASGAAIAAKNDAVLNQNRASDTWAFYQARSIKKNLYEIASASTPDQRDEFARKARQYDDESATIKTKAEDLERRTEADLHTGEVLEHRHHVLTVAATFLHCAIAVATMALVARRRHWPWYVSLGLGTAGLLTTASAYLV